VVSSDVLRALTGTGEADMDATADAFEILHQVVRARMRRRLTTCVDATNVARKHRLPLLSYAASYDVPAVAVIAWPPLATCLERHAARAGNGNRASVVPENVIRQQYIQLVAEMPSRSEGFARVIVTGGEDWAARAGEARLSG
jgi:predicted kinase